MDNSHSRQKRGRCAVSCLKDEGLEEEKREEKESF